MYATPPLTDEGISCDFSFKPEFVIKMIRRFEPIIAAARALGEVVIGYFTDIKDDIGDVKVLVDGKDPAEDIKQDIEQMKKCFEDEAAATDTGTNNSNPFPADMSE